ncbi:MAG: hypothetical protein EOL95_04600 [Bacteroidia bacterium]|nr:hypothetical protein [Bacteroidia bacterium]
MRKTKFSTASALLLLFLGFAGFTSAQQLANSNFESWGNSFDGNPQPSNWTGSNVTQVGMNFTLVYQSTDAHTGSYSVKMADKEVGAMGITEISPSWLTLGTPWSYLEGLSTSSATAGTDGGISFAYRPDTMAVWIKRQSNGLEDMNLVCYSWRGQSKGEKYLNKGNGCTSTTHYNEESDIRQSTDKNSCGTSVQATQVAEGLLRTKTVYNSWTLVKVPITYYNDLIPEKMNIILSASNYPNFRANGGLYDGNSLLVDDISLIYSSKIHGIRLNGIALPGFKTNTTEYTYEIAKGASIPTITCYRSGRLLSGSEISVKYGAVGTPTEITVKAEDGSSTTTYKVTFVYTRSQNCKLNEISVNGTPISGFNGAVTNYTVALPFGTTEFPTITYTKGDEYQTVTIEPCAIPGTAKVVVTAENPDYSNTYLINFTVGELTDTTLQDILVNGVSITGYAPTKTIYNVNVPVGTTEAPVLSYKSAYADGLQTIVISQKGLSETSTITVSAPGASTSRIYKISYNITESSYSYLQDIKLDGVTLTDFNPLTLTYTCNLPQGTTTQPVVTWTQGDAYQTVSKEDGGIDGITKITVKAQNGVNTSIYRISFTSVKSSNSKLTDLKLDGVTLTDFSSDNTSYTCNLPIGTTTLPDITWTQGDSYQNVVPTYGGVNGLTKITVYAQDNTVTVYSISFSVSQANVSTLKDILLDGVSLVGFNPNTTSYNVELTRGTTSLPAITWVAYDEYQKITKLDGGISGDTRITVKAQSGAITVYVLSFSVAKSSNALLSDIKVGGESLTGFASETFEYDYVLPSGTTILPEISYTKADSYQKVSVLKNGVSGITDIKVTAEDGTESVYKISFSVEKSENAALKDIKVGGVSLPDFDPNTFNYTYVLAAGVTQCPDVTVEKNEGQSVTIVVPKLTGIARIEVVPEVGSKNVYTINFTYQQSDNSKLADLLVDGVSISGFSSETTQYSYVLPQGTTELPSITYLKAEDSQIVELTENGVNGTSTISVKAENASVTTYQITFSVVKSSNAYLADIQIAGSSLIEFEETTYTYNYVLPEGTTSLPIFKPIKADPGQVISVSLPSLQGTASVVVTSEDGSATNKYFVNFAFENKSDAVLENIFLDGVALTDFSSSVYTYNVTLPVGSAKPIVSYDKSYGSQVVISLNDANQTELSVYAEDGTLSKYVINFSYVANNNALLADLQVYENASQTFVSLADFSSDKFDYSKTISLGSTDIPTINPVPATAGQTITITYGQVNASTNIHVVAEDGVTTADYVIDFSVEKSTENSLTNISVGGNDVPGFDPDVLNYVMTLPYGTKTVPTITYDKNYFGETVQLTASDINSVSYLKVIAEDGSSRIYSLQFNVSESGLENVLSTIMLDDEAVSGFSANQYTYDIVLPFGTTQMPDISYVKRYEEQTVATTISGMSKIELRVKSNQVGVADAIYSINFTVAQYQSTVLSDIKLDNVSLTGFNSYKTKYVVLLTSIPSSIDAISPATNIIAEKIINTTNHVRFTVSNTFNSETITYDLYLHYTNDVIPNGEFTSWTTPKYNASRGAVKPTMWNVPADAAEKKTIFSTSYTGTEVANVNNTIAHFTTTYWSVLGGAIPAVATIGDIACTLKVAGQTTVSYSGGIAFRNTPDVASIRYNLATVKGNGALFAFNFDGVDYNYTTSSKTSDYVVYNHPLALSGKSPAQMNIAINATNQTSGMLAGNEGASLYVDYIRFQYSSKISSISVNGVTAGLSGTTANANIESEYCGLPKIDIVGQVSDQEYDIVYGDENGGQRVVSIRSYAEDKTYTDYTLNITRPISSNTNLSNITVNGVSISDFSADKYEYTQNVSKGTKLVPDVVAYGVSSYQTITSQINDNACIINVTAENGATATYTINFVETYLSDATLANLSVSGYDISYQADNNEYDVVLAAATKELPIINFQKRTDGQIVILTEGNVNGLSTINVVAEDGVTSNTYSINFSVAPFDNTTSKLSGMSIVDAMNPLVFNSDVYEYVYPRALNETWYVAYTRAYAEDNMTCVLTDDSLVWNLSNVVSSTAQSYKLNFENVLSNNTQLTDIKLNGVSLEGFNPYIVDYIVDVQRTETVDAEAILAEDGQTLVSDYDPSTKKYTFTVTAPDNIATQVYTVNLNVLKSTNSSLANILINEESIEGFTSSKLDYVVELAQGTVSLPSITYVSGDYGQTVDIQTNGVDGVTYITVVAEDGTSETTYSIDFNVEKSSNALLTRISADYVQLEDFASDVFEYTVKVVVGKNIPLITYQKAEESQTVTELTDVNKLTLTVTAEDGTTNDYVINFETQYTSISTLSDIKLNNVSISGFASDLFDYNYMLPVGTKVLPEIAVVIGADAQTVDLQTNGVSGDAVITVTADDNVTKSIYTIHFSVEQSSVATLNQIMLDGVQLDNFESDIFEYNIELPVGTKTLPIVTTENGDEYQTVTQTTESTDITIHVAAENGTVNDYVLHFNILKSINDTLSMIYIGGEELSVEAEGFVADNSFRSDLLEYNITLPVGSSFAALKFDYQAGDEYQTVDTIRNESLMSFKVTAEDIAYTKTYTVNVIVEKSDNAELLDLMLDGITISGFSFDKTEYNIDLAVGTTVIPAVTWTAGDEYQTITLSMSEDQKTQVVKVVAESGRTVEYAINFTILKSSDTTLKAITIGDDRQLIPSFDGEVLVYQVLLPYNNQVVPAIEYEKMEEAQTVEMTGTTDVHGTAYIKVTAENGVDNQTYSITFDVEPSDNTNLSMIYYNGVEVQEFDANDNDYNVVLPFGTTDEPVITYDLAEPETQVAVSNTIVTTEGWQSIITVTAASGDANEYVVNLGIAKSSENRLKTLNAFNKLVEGFDPDIEEYEIVYKAYTDSSVVPTISDITYELFDTENSSAVVLETSRGTIVIAVTAENGEVRNYVLKTVIEISDNTNLSSISIEDILIENFDPSIHDYYYTLPFGTSFVDVEMLQYEKTEQGQEVTLVKDGMDIQLQVRAQDGVSIGIYIIHFVPDDFDPSVTPTADEVCITSTDNGGWKFATKCSNVDVYLSDMAGRMIVNYTLPLVDPNIEDICSPEAEGYIYKGPSNQVVLYYFVYAKKRVISSGKFRTSN